MKKLSFWLSLLAIPLLVPIICVSGKLMPVLKAPPDLATITVKFIKLCYGERASTIGLSGNVTGSSIAAFSADDSIGIISLNSDRRSVQCDVTSIMSQHKLQIIMVATTSTNELEETLADLKKSRWWNHMAQFYIFHSSSEKMDCTGAYEYLWTAWMMDILRAKFICNHDVEGTLIYAFNPYTKYGPDPWKLKGTYKGKNDHPWNLLTRKYGENAVFCKNIDFDSTKNAGGYEVRFTSLKGRMLSNSSKTGKFSPHHFNNAMYQMISQYMNVHFNIVIHPLNEPLGFVDKEGKSFGLLGDLTDGRSDVLPRVTPQFAIRELPSIYPSLFVQYFAVTQYTDYIPQWRKVISAVDGSSRIGILVVSLVSAIFLKYALRQSFVIALMNTVRVIICNGSFTRLPNNLGPRIYLSCLLCFVIIVQALYQGQLSAQLSKRVRYPSVNNRRDLVESNYIIYAHYNESKLFSDPVFAGRFIAKDTWSKKCTEYVLENPAVACIGARQGMIKDAIKLKLHMSEHTVAEVPMNWPIRDNWPLEERLNRHFSHFLESGLFYYLLEKSFQNDHRILKANENVDPDVDFKILTVEDLGFSFVILGFGLACALISFVVELFFLKRPSSRINDLVRTRRQLRPRFFCHVQNRRS